MSIWYHRRYQDANAGTSCPGRVLAHVGERFLDDTVGRELSTRRQRTRLALNGEPDREPGGTHLSEQVVEVGQSRYGISGVFVRIGTQRRDGPLHLADCLPAGGGDLPHHLAGPIR